MTKYPHNPVLIMKAPIFDRKKSLKGLWRSGLHLYAGPFPRVHRIRATSPMSSFLRSPAGFVGSGGFRGRLEFGASSGLCSFYTKDCLCLSVFALCLFLCARVYVPVRRAMARTRVDTLASLQSPFLHMLRPLLLRGVFWFRGFQTAIDGNYVTAPGP